MAAIFGETKIFENWDGYTAETPCGSKISSNSLYLAQFSRYKHFVFCNFCEKCENSKWPPFWARQNFFFKNWDGLFGVLRRFQRRQFWRDFVKIGIVALQRYPVGQKFRRNRSIMHGHARFCAFLCFPYLENL